MNFIDFKLIHRKHVCAPESFLPGTSRPGRIAEVLATLEEMRRQLPTVSNLPISQALECSWLSSKLPSNVFILASRLELLLFGGGVFYVGGWQCSAGKLLLLLYDRHVPLTGNY